MVQLLFERVISMLDNLEQNVGRFQRDPRFRRSGEELIHKVVRIRTHIGLEADLEDSKLDPVTADRTRLRARRSVDNMIAEARELIQHINNQYDVVDKSDKLPYDTMENVTSRFSLVTRLLDQARSSIDYKDSNMNLVPREAPAPVRVVIRNGRIELIAPKKHIGSVPDRSVENLRVASRDILRSAISLLFEVGNADPRLTRCCEGLAIELSAPLDQMSIEALGLNWQIVGEAIDISGDSVPEIILAQLRRVLTTVSVMLGQYEEWQVYLAAEAGAKLKPDQVLALANQALELSKELEGAPEAADARISERIKLIVDPLSTGIVQSDTIGVPLMGSLSNIFATMSHAALETLPGGASPEGKISGGILVTNLSLTLIQKFAPTLASFPPLRWIVGVNAEINKHWSNVKDAIKLP